MRGAAPARPALVVIFQRGGCDGLNTVVPYGDPDYAGLRPTIGIPAPGQGAAYPALDLDGFFGLHPSMSSLIPVFQAGDLAVLPTVQYPGFSRSHFDSQNFIESAIREDGYDGWLNRYLQSSFAPGQMRAVGFGSSLAQSLRGSVPVASFSQIGAFGLGLPQAEEDTLIDHVLPVYSQGPNPPTASRRLVYDFGQLLFDTLDVARSIDTANYLPANGAVYPNTGYGRQLREIAQLLKEPGIELEIATVDIGGWDTHSDQGAGEPSGRQARRLAELANGIAALYLDLGPLMDQVIILTMTEFGRTAKENGSRGTDHGCAAAWFAAGHGINGGVYTGSAGWPGLSESQLRDGRYLDFTVDYRDIMGDVLLNHLGNPNLAEMLPGHVYAPLGLVG